METRWGRVTRGWAAGGFATLAAATSHALAGGGFSNLVGLVLAVTFAGVTCMALAGRRLSLPRLASSVVLGQFAFHSVFSTIGASGGQVIGPVGHHGGAYMFLPEGVVAGHTAMTMTVFAGGWMWLAHAIAAAITIAALRHGETAFWGLRESTRMLVAQVWRWVRVVPARVTVRVDKPAIIDSITPRAVRKFLEAVRYRGPPLGIRFA
jgi:hypothetical protein